MVTLAPIDFLTEAEYNREHKRAVMDMKPLNGSNRIPKPAENMVPLHGTHIYPSGEYYCGWWLHNLPHGQGVLKRSGGEQYSGEWRNGLMHGRGTFKWIDQNEYRGTFENGFRHGKGLLFEKRSWYKGGWHKGKRDGHGLAVYDPELLAKHQHATVGATPHKGWVQYTGSFHNDKPGGRGNAIYMDGSEYSGDWSNGLRHGQGSANWSNGASYQGGWVDDVPHGEGEYIWRDGNRYSGEWKHGKRDGKGKMYFTRTTILRDAVGVQHIHRAGDMHDGYYVQGVRKGLGTYYHADGRVFDAIWIDDHEYKSAVFRKECGGPKIRLLDAQDDGKASTWSTKAVEKCLCATVERGWMYAQGIQSYAINGKRFLEMNNEDLRQKLNIRSRLIRKRILDRIQELRRAVEIHALVGVETQLVEMLDPLDKDYARAKSMLAERRGMTLKEQTRVEFEVARIYKVHNTVLDKKFEEYGHKLREQATDRTLGERSQIGFFTASSNKVMESIAINGPLPLGHKGNPSEVERDRWFGDPRKGVYVTRQLVHAIHQLSSQASQLVLGDDDEDVSTSHRNDDVIASSPDMRLEVDDVERSVELHKVMLVECYPGKTFQFKEYWQFAKPKGGYDSHLSRDGFQWYLFYPEAGQLRPLYIYDVLVWKN